MSEHITITVTNPLGISRKSQTVEIPVADLASAGLSNEGKTEPAFLHVMNEKGTEIVCQTTDSNGDGTQDLLIFQADFSPEETKIFKAVLGEKRIYTKDQFKAYGRFVRERYDDFCWENDRIAHRIYGKALESWKANPLTSSTVDVWVKRTKSLVVNDWLMVDNYHVDIGDGADFYSAGLSRGCGGNGLWAADKLWVSRNFVDSRLLAGGPLRVDFEVIYEPFPVNGVMVSEIKRISLDAGQNLSHFRSYYKAEKAIPLVSGAGLKKVEGDHYEVNKDRAWLVKWEPVEMNMGEQGLAIIINPQEFEGKKEDDLNLLMLGKAVGDRNECSYWCGFSWNRAGHYDNYEDWKDYVDGFAQGLKAPVTVSLS